MGTFPLCIFTKNIFAWVKQELIKLAPRPISELKEKLEIVWAKINPEFLKPYCDSMSYRCQMAIESGGFPIN